MTERKKMSRRMFGAVAGGLGAAALTPGCAIASKVIPTICVDLLAEVIEVVGTHFAAKWSAGSLANSVTPIPSRLDSRAFESQDQQILDAFAAAAAASATPVFQSPVVELWKDCSPIGIVQVQSENTWLMAGVNSQAFWVRREWVRFLVEEDNCDLLVAADTAPHEKCPWDDDCPVMISRQNFQYRSGEKLELHFTYPDTASDEAYHLTHSEKFRGCPRVPSRPLQQS